MTDVAPDDVLAFWFEPRPTTEEELMARIKRWFVGGAEMDAEVIRRFGDAVETAVSGGFESWMDTPRGRLALVILLDQFTRNVFRDQPRMYAGDPRAQRIARESFSDGTAEKLDYDEQLFLSMPLMHAESLELQDRMAELADHLSASAPPLYRKMAGMHREQSTKYRDIIARFGRFPHRNEVLGRETTHDEAEFLVDWSKRFPPRGAPRR